MNVRGLVWLGVDTPKYDEMVRFVQGVLRLSVIFEGEWAGAPTVEFECPNGSRVQVTLGAEQAPPTALFEVDDLVAARRELEEAGVEVLGPDSSDSAWSWFTILAPDGNKYSLGQRLA